VTGTGSSGRPTDGGLPPAGLAARLGVRPGARVAVLHAPDGVDAALEPLPAGVVVQHGLRRSDRVDLVVGFVTERSHLARNIGWLVATLGAGGAFWVVWPAGTSPLATDLSADAVAEVAAPVGWAIAERSTIGDGWTAVRLGTADEMTAAPPERS
jgi:hypothetical protein